MAACRCWNSRTDAVLPESGAILWYLAEGTYLVPADKWHRAQALQWMFFEQYSHEPYVAVARFWLAYAPKAELDKKRHLVGEWHEKGNAALGVMETHLARMTGSPASAIRSPISRCTATPIAPRRAASICRAIPVSSHGLRAWLRNQNTFRCRTYREALQAAQY